MNSRRSWLRYLVALAMTFRRRPGPGDRSKTENSGGSAGCLRRRHVQVQAISQTFRAVGKQVRPAVVTIDATVQAAGDNKAQQKKSRRPNIDPKDLPEPFREFFQDFGEAPEQPTPQYGRGQRHDHRRPEGLDPHQQPRGRW